MKGLDVEVDPTGGGGSSIISTTHSVPLIGIVKSENLKRPPARLQELRNTADNPFLPGAGGCGGGGACTGSRTGEAPSSTSIRASI
uniref:Uncharacterized protein n=1 Tax=Tanacetum cinerariifolium TaxID=118510 RepID=A0A699GGD7_TANCI|nr:hypothetical protein [Tanacetum cinerariifolium]